MDLIVCVGDHCHLNGSEEVVRSFQERLAAEGLADRVTLKGSFCLGKCSTEDAVAVRCGDEVFHTQHAEAAACFRDRIQPLIEAQMTDV